MNTEGLPLNNSCLESLPGAPVEAATHVDQPRSVVLPEGCHVVDPSSYQSLFGFLKCKADRSWLASVLEDLPPTSEGATLVSVSKGNSRQIAAMLSHVTQEMLDNDLDAISLGPSLASPTACIPAQDPNSLDREVLADYTSG